MTSAAVDFRSVSHVYGSRKALDEVSFGIAEGEIFALLGPNGGGKTKATSTGSRAPSSSAA
jgi:ABC-2 type transport system ATP-binding protein